jgi:signal transduction histidine kinase
MVQTRLLVATPLRLALLAVAVVLVALALLIGWTFSATNAVLTRQVARAISADLVALTDEFDRSSRAGLLAAIEDRRQADPDSLYLLLSGKGGVRIGGNIAYVAPEHENAGDGYVFHYVRQTAAGPRERLAAAAQKTLPDGSVLIVGRDIEEQRQYIDHLRHLLLGGLITVSLLGLGGGLLVGRHILRRIDDMSHASRVIMAGDLSGRIPRRGTGDELDRLADSLNAMLERMERLMLGLREVSDNIAHDLKTPLNRLRNRAEAALREGSSSEAWREGLERTIEEADELIKTFNALLLITKLEAGALEDTLEPIDLAEVVTELVELYEPAAEEAGFKLQCSASARVPIRANRQLIGQAVANLIDNAIKYSAGAVSADAASAPSIRVTVTADARNGEVAVADCGPGIAPADRVRALQRFVRLEASRSRPGTGLGLSLVTAVAQMHGGSVRLEDNAPGLRAILSVPLDASRRSERAAALEGPAISNKVEA